MDILPLLRPRSTLPPLSLYASYIQERENKFIIESDKGFATYTFVSDGCYIEDIYVTKEHRKSGEAARMADQIAEIAIEKGYLRLYGTVAPRANGATDSIKVLLAYGFRVNGSDANLIYMVKDLV